MQIGLTEELRQEISAAVEASGCELVHAELHGNQLQVILDRGEGVTITDCELVSRRLSAALDVLDFGDSRYLLEVSSPGLDRKLYGPHDYQRFSGHLARITWADPESGKRTDIGRIAPFEEGETKLGLALAGGKELQVPLANLQEARLEIEV